MSSCHQVRSWSGLPSEILTVIGKHLDSRIDVFIFRAVCHNWRSSLNLAPNSSLLSPVLPCKITNPTLPFNDRPNDPLLLVARTVLLVKPLNPSEYDHPTQWIITVEEMVPGKLRILYPLSNNYVSHLPSNFPKYLNLLEFRVSEIAKFYVLKHASDGKDVADVRKVVLCSEYTAMVLYGEGMLVGVRLKNGKWSYVRDSLLTLFGDVINVKGLIYGVDYNGKLCVIDHMRVKVIKVFLADRMFGTHYKLAENNGELYLVQPCIIYYSCVTRIEMTVYNMDKLKHKWVEKIKGYEALFLSIDGCFFVQDVGKDYFFYSAKCTFLGSESPKITISGRSNIDLQIGVIGERRPCYEEGNWHWISDMLWPPPTWFWTDDFSSTGEDDDSEEMDFNTGDVSVIHGKEVMYPPPSFTLHSSTAAAVNNKQGLITKSNGISMHSVTMEDSHVLRVQNINPCVSTTIFEGVNIKSNLVPTLQNIWSKHGNVLIDCKIRNGDFIARALESLATTVLILKSSSGRSLNETQANYISSVLSDVKCMQLKVDWLVPFVEKALAVDKSKTLINSLKEFSEVKALAQEKKLKVLDEIAKLDEVEEDLRFVFEKIPVLEDVDLDQSLGDGLC